MPLIRTADLMTAGGAVTAFNVITVEHAEAIAAGAEAAGAPAILQISENAVKYHGNRLAPIAAATAAVARASTARLALHLDHVESTDLLHAAHTHDFSSVMFDASNLPYTDNVKSTAAAARWAHDRDLWLEAELGRIGGKAGDAHTPGVRTDPAEAAAYATETGIDALAVAVGSTHAMTTRTATLDHTLITALREAVPVPLVLHGSSGVPDEELRRAVTAGITKINVGTALNTAFTGAVRAFLETHPSTADPRRYLAPAREAMAETVANYVRAVSSAKRSV
ncbi:class II fructose-bisphosphate aldolase [Streptoverticillium reticulum]|uniref:class II fructose-bisphosphate aldolase n=1 Tax=Streptoverticillium reticulum TaxID=1433415 RepID=UPI0039BFFEE0